jgi:phytoene dehydrogenase-like protein
VIPDSAGHADDVWDYLVVGGGHNGLVAACTLAETGASVLVLERMTSLGGLSGSGRYLDSAPDHVLSPGAMDDVFMSSTSLAADLQLPRHGHRAARLDHPYGWIGEDGETLLLFHDYQRTLDDVRYFSPRDARAYAELRPALDWLLDTQDLVLRSQPDQLPKKQLLAQLARLAPRGPVRRAVGRMLSRTLVEMVAETFESDQMRSLLTYWGSMLGPIDFDGAGFLCVALAGVHRSPGVMRPRGGMGGLIAAMASRLEELGGETRTGAAVERVLVDHGRARGVRLADGTELEARHGILVTAAPQIALGELLDPGVLDASTRAKVAILPANANGSATFKVDLAASGAVSYPRAQAVRNRRDGADLRRTSLMTGTFEDQLAQLGAIRRNSTLERPPVYMAVLSANDETLAPPGQDVVYLASNMPVQPTGGWTQERERYGELLLRSVGRFMDGLESEIGRMISSPADFEDRYGTPRGAYFHVDMTPMRLGMNRPARGLGGYTTPVQRYFLAGAGTHPGGGVSGWPGRLAAQKALRERAAGGRSCSRPTGGRTTSTGSQPIAPS